MRENETEDLIELNFEGDNDFPIIREDGLRRDVTSLVTVTAAGKIEAVAIAVNLGSIEEVVKDKVFLLSYDQNEISTHLLAFSG